MQYLNPDVYKALAQSQANCRSHSFGRFVGVRVRVLGICVPNPSIVALTVSEISAFIRTDGEADRRTWLDQLG